MQLEKKQVFSKFDYVHLFIEINTFILHASHLRPSRINACYIFTGWSLDTAGTETL